MTAEKDDLGQFEDKRLTRVEEEQLGNLAHEEEHEESKLEALRRHPRACAWCMYALVVVVLTAFESSASGSILGIPEFRKDFGYAVVSGGKTQYTLSANWQSAFLGGPVAASTIGTILVGPLADRFGRRPIVMINLALTFGAISMEFVAETPALFFGGRFLSGLTIGFLTSIMMTYISDIAPMPLRGLFTCLVALTYTLAGFIASIILKFTGSYNNRWAYRAIFCSQYGFAVICSLFVWFMPESPWWLVSKGRRSQALINLSKLGYAPDVAHRRLAYMESTLEKVRAETEASTYLECLRKSNRRRTIISLAPASIQLLAGVSFSFSYFTYYAQLAGYSTPEAFRLYVGLRVLAVAGNVISWFLIDRVGRRRLVLWGLFAMTVVLMLIGALAVVGEHGNTTALKGTVALMMVYGFCYQVSYAPTLYTILAEVPTSRLRLKTISIGLTVEGALSLTLAFVLPRLFNVDKANLGGKIAFIFGGLGVISLVYLWFALPETAGRTFQELDEMFMKGIPTRKFAGYVCDSKSTGAATEPKGLEDTTKETKTVQI
ncbi:putative maltose permease [Dactylonectria macrodidyma]|uniref:Maltose permease n=1 Tax=Dactylonectria macrodidyma TaxID=307937 RepID=A0A9P9IHV3_9HYPO|nr:putative maltose permease [Dactylonectria macrodidyma]